MLLDTAYPTLAEMAKTWDPDGRHAQVVQLLTQSNEILMDMPIMPSNEKTGHLTSVQSGLPDVFLRGLNEFIPSTKGTFDQIRENMATIESFLSVDKKEADISGNAQQYRMEQGNGHAESMNQAMSTYLFYGSHAADKKQFDGFATRYSSLSAGNGGNIVDGGGTGSDNLSIWLVGWGPLKTMAIYPKHTMAGLDHKDWGEVLETKTVNGAVKQMAVYKDQWMWDLGLTVMDWRYVVRIANIDVSDLNSGSPPDLPELMRDAVELPPFEGTAKFVWYMNRTARKYLRKQSVGDVSTGGGLTFDNVAGKKVRMWDEYPVRIVDALTNNESRVT
jgi:hypothetical protein